MMQWCPGWSGSKKWYQTGAFQGSQSWSWFVSRRAPMNPNLPKTIRSRPYPCPGPASFPRSGEPAERDRGQPGP